MAHQAISPRGSLIMNNFSSSAFGSGSLMFGIPKSMSMGLILMAHYSFVGFAKCSAESPAMLQPSLIAVKGATIASVAASSKQNWFASADGDLLDQHPDLVSEVIIWNKISLKPIATLSCKSSRVGSVAFSSDSNYLAASTAKTISVWETSKWSEQKSISHDGKVGGIPVFLPNNKHLAHLVELDCTVDKPYRILCELGIYDLQTNKCLASVKNISNATSLVVNPDGTFVALVALNDKKLKPEVRFYSLPDLKLLRKQFLSEADDVIAISPDGEYLAAAGGWDSEEPSDISVYKLADLKLVCKLSGHKGPIVTDLKFYNNNILISATGFEYGEPGEVNVWDIEKRRQITGFKWPNCWIKSIAALQNDKKLVIGGCKVDFKAVGGGPTHSKPFLEIVKFDPD
jgi:WD40 repeat protein